MQLTGRAQCTDMCGLCRGMYIWCVKGRSQGVGFDPPQLHSENQVLMYLSICFFIVLSWLLVRVERGKMKLLLLRYISITPFQHPSH
jgi:hypothetical protein